MAWPKRYVSAAGGPVGPAIANAKCSICRRHDCPGAGGDPYYTCTAMHSESSRPEGKKDN